MNDTLSKIRLLANIMASSSEGAAERSLRRKTDKLIACTREAEREIADIEQRRKRDKRARADAADDEKADFLREAAAMRRRIDESTEQLQELQRTVTTDTPELIVLRQKMSEQQALHRERRVTLEREKQERLEALREEINYLREFEPAETS